MKLGLPSQGHRPICRLGIKLLERRDMLLGLCGSLRQNSVNAKLMREAARIYGGPFEEGNLRLPLYDGDLEDQGIPEEVTALADQIRAADAVPVVFFDSTHQFCSGIFRRFFSSNI